MSNKPYIIPKSITDKVDEIKKLQDANPDCHIAYVGRRSIGKILIQQLLQTEDIEIVNEKQLPPPNNTL